MTRCSARTWRRAAGVALLLLACLAVGFLPQSGHADNSGFNPPFTSQPDTAAPTSSQPADPDTTQVTTSGTVDISLWDMVVMILTL